MKRFRFSLAALLSLRREQTRKSEFLLATELGKLMAIKNRIRKAGEAGDSALLSSGANLDELRMRENLLRKALNERETLKPRLAEAEKSVERVRHTYMEDRSKSAALEKLRERRRYYWNSRIKQEEIKNLDEIAKGTVSRLNEIEEEQ